ncbi:hypothetical protein [Aquimarina rubra]|uniref:Outer membrane protein beta-barrel domain-containing protein n=1 Tax=Aquimarina rubra TaxID=1920033 RepID=A0ABW5LJM6_9FLAO
MKRLVSHHYLNIHLNENNRKRCNNDLFGVKLVKYSIRNCSFLFNPLKSVVSPQTREVYPKRHFIYTLISEIGFFKLTDMNKFLYIILVLLLTSVPLSAQEEQENNKLRFKAFSVGAGFYKADYRRETSSSSNGRYQVGISAFTDLSFYLKKHIFSAQAFGGRQLVFYNNSNNPPSVYSFSLLYGRELEVKRWFKIEGHMGLGYYAQERDVIQTVSNPPNIIITEEGLQKDVTLGAPVNLKFSFYMRKHIGLGFTSQVVFNSLNTTYSGNIFFHVKLP